MEYSDFRRIIEEGEREHIDFKIKCEAFSKGGIAANGELAKDICAMANNGNKTSYIIIGVSDNAKEFRSAVEKGLTDDNLQDFCKKAISPPPKVILFRRNWSTAKKEHLNVEFVVIQVGPNPKQVFRLQQDFIDFNQKICLRRNEVWIRRNATTDLATPEEIIRIANIRHRFEIIRPEIQKYRKEFETLSINEKRKLVNETIVSKLESKELKNINEGFWTNEIELSRGNISYTTLWKKEGFIAFIVNAISCQPFLHKDMLEPFAWQSRNL
jgi:hypothetical protein